MRVERGDLEASLLALKAEVRDPNAGLFGPGSAAWSIARESILIVGGGCAALLQLAHPYVAHGVANHSVALTDQRGRFQRTFAYVFAMAFGDLEHAISASRRVFGTHERVRGPITEATGKFEQGHHYEANHEEALFWVHATLVDTALKVFHLWVRPLEDEERDAYYQETKRIARLFGVTDRVMPKTWIDFEVYFDKMVNEVLAVGKPARQIASAILAAPNLALEPAFARLRNTTAGLLPAKTREQFGLAFGRKERVIFDVMVRSERAVYGLLPPSLRYFPAYQSAMQRVMKRRSTRRDRWGRQAHRWIVKTLLRTAKTAAVK
jgi:uncharacterized protein (DUF2236 family)